MLFIFSGLPGTGKSSIAKEIAKYYKSIYLRIDTIEHGIKELCNISVQGEGYRLSYRIAADNLLIGNTVVADCCNPWLLTRTEWEEVAIRNNCDYVNIEIICSDKEEHKKRVEERKNDISGFVIPEWDDVLKRDYQEWEKPVIQIDTARKRKEDSIIELIQKIERKIQLTNAST